MTEASGVAAFTWENPAFDPSRVRSIGFHFDRTPSGTVFLDAVGFRIPGLAERTEPEAVEPLVGR